MAEIRVITDVAGRVCAISSTPGADIGEGDDIVLVEAMKMEIPVPAPAGGKLREILVQMDDMVAEGQTVAILEI